MKKRIIILFLLLIVIRAGFSQQPNFIHHWYSMPVSIPATEALDEMASLSLQSKINHFGNGYDYFSSLVSGKYPLINNTLNKGSIGISYLQNHSNAPGQLLHQSIQSNLSYSFHYNRFQGIAMGLHAGWVSKKIDESNIKVEEMWVPGMGFTGSGSGEIGLTDRLNYPKIGGSVLWFSEDRNRDINAYLGVSAHGLNKVNGSFFQNGDSYLDRTVVIMGGARLSDKNNLALTPKFCHTSFNGNYTLKLGMDFNYSLARFSFGKERRSNSLNFELNYVLNNGPQLGIQVIQPAYVLGFGYNMNAYSGNQQFEFDNVFEFLLVLRKPTNLSKERDRSRRVRSKKDNEKDKINRGRRTEERTPEAKTIEELDVISSLPVQQDTLDTSNENEPIIEEPGHELDSSRFKQNVEEDYEWESVITLGEFTGIGFDFNSTDIGESAKKILDQIVEIVNSDPENKIVLIGHADAIGTDKVNQKISWERAKTVAEILVDRGVSEDRIILQAKGEEQPIATNETSEGRALNRRVEFFVIKTK